MRASVIIARLNSIRPPKSVSSATTLSFTIASPPLTTSPLVRLNTNSDFPWTGAGVPGNRISKIFESSKGVGFSNAGDAHTRNSEEIDSSDPVSRSSLQKRISASEAIARAGPSTIKPYVAYRNRAVQSAIDFEHHGLDTLKYLEISVIRRVVWHQWAQPSQSSEAYCGASAGIRAADAE